MRLSWQLLIALCLFPCFSSEAAPVRASFLNDSKALSETIGLLRAADCTSDAVEAFRKAVERYNSSGIDLNVSAFPSLRQGFYNRGLLRAAQELAPDWVEVHFFDKTMGKMTGGRRNVQSPLDVPRLGMA